ncbi:MAG: aldolase [Methanoregula sp.]|nr:aldolase [Methanoregula sp.]
MHAGEFERIGKRLFLEHLVGGNFGNMSVREGSGFFIKRTGAYLDVAEEPVFVPLTGDVPGHASSEYRVHREVYKNTGYRAVVHAHPPFSVTASLVMDAIVPEDSEGKMFCPVIPVVTGPPGSQEIADNVGQSLRSSRLVVVRGHGTFAGGATLDEAYVLTSLCEHACRVIALKRSFELSG